MYRNTVLRSDVVTSLGSKLATEDARISGLEKEAQQLRKQVKQLEAALGEREWNDAEDGKNPYANRQDRTKLETTLEQPFGFLKTML